MFLTILALFAFILVTVAVLFVVEHRVQLAADVRSDAAKIKLDLSSDLARVEGRVKALEQKSATAVAADASAAAAAIKTDAAKV